MKKQYLPLVLALALGQNIYAQSRFDAGAQIYADYYQNFVREPGATLPQLHAVPFTLDATSRSEVKAEIMAVLNEGTSAEDLEAYGLEVRGIVGPVAVCYGAMDDIIALADTDLTLSITFPKQLSYKLNNARSESCTGTDLVHDGTGLSSTYTGKGIVAGIFDVGMDPNHVNFMNSTLTESRVKAVWEYDSRGRVRSYTTPDEIAGYTTDDNTMNHGTHTTGCLAGSYKGKGDYYTVSGLSLSGSATAHRNEPLPYYGMAPDADIAMACGWNSSANIVLACNKIKEYIKESGKPGLISLSFGSNLGPHDNSGEATMALNAIGKEVPLFIAAGNEGTFNYSILKTFSSTEKSVTTSLKVANSSSGNGVVEIWSGDNRPLKLRLFIYDRTAKKELFGASLDKEGSLVLANTSYTTPGYLTDAAVDLAFTRSTIDAVQKLSAVNNRYQIVINSNLSLASGNGAQRYVLGIEISGENGQRFDLVNGRYEIGNLQLELHDWGISGWNAGNAEMSISNLACGPDVICVGAWNSRRSWANLAGNIQRYSDKAYDVGKIAPFTSYGTLVDGRTLPMICAPGTGIISSQSSYYYNANGLSAADVAASTTVNGKTHYFVASQGTSMACPVAAGIGVLWLQANPHLTPAEVRQIVKETATPANDPGNEVRWGYGKINAIDGIKMAVKLGAGVSDVAVNPADIIISSNGNNWQVVAPGAASVKTVVYDLNGRPVLTSDVEGDTAEINGDNLQPGIYVMKVNDTLSRRVAVK